MKTKQWGDIWEEKIRSQNEVGIIHGTASSMKRILNQLKNDMKFISSWVYPLIPKHGKILDCGIGPMARYAIEFSKMGYNVTGVDISPTTIKFAKKWTRKAGQEIKFVNCNLIDLSKIEEKFDLVFCIETFGHIPAYLSLKTLEQFNKKLKTNGHCFIHFWIDKEKSFGRLFYEFLYFSLFKMKKKFTKVFSVNASNYTPEELKDMCNLTGFRIIKKKNGYYLLQKIRDI